MDLLDKRGGRIALSRLGSGILAEAGRSADDSLLVVFEDRETGLLRVVHHEVVIRFKPAVPERRRRAILGGFGFAVLRRNAFIPDQMVVRHPEGRYAGEDLIEISNRLIVLDEVALATPNFVSQYRRQAPPSILPQEWHLGSQSLDILTAWKLTTGRRKVVVAVLDDGVDVDHPNLRANLWRNPDPSARDQIGRDFFLPDAHPDHFNPRPKKFRYPFDRTKGNDIHGTACAGLIAAGGIGRGSVGVAPGCRLLPVKIFHGDDLAPDERVADAIRYAASHADVLSCSWTGGGPDVEQALEDAGGGRQGLGAAVFCAAGNDFGAAVGFPARVPHAIAVGASTDQRERADYSNVGPEIAVVAPSSGGVRSLFVSDLSLPGRGFNPCDLYANSFGGTSAATALAAGVGALVLSVHPDLCREELKELLQATAGPMGEDSDEVGTGQVNAGRAVEEAVRLVRRPGRADND
ncbi:MAG TPA: S8 family serine peptidase [Thermoanaerobaculia bacterium]|jgi:subtilisin family serine protease|nr:S8 family serine peptidase [Thermoanaerobaculia bacterium]